MGVFERPPSGGQGAEEMRTMHKRKDIRIQSDICDVMEGKQISKLWRHFFDMLQMASI